MSLALLESATITEVKLIENKTDSKYFRGTIVLEFISSGEITEEEFRRLLMDLIVDLE